MILQIMRGRKVSVDQYLPSHLCLLMLIKIDRSGLGYQMMSSMGWNPGKGLGASQHGPLTVLKSSVKVSKKGIGSKDDGVEKPWEGLSHLDKLFDRLNGKGVVEKKEEPRYSQTIRGKMGMVFVKGDKLEGTIVDQEKKEPSSVDNVSIDDKTETRMRNKDERKEKKKKEKLKDEKRDKKTDGDGKKEKRRDKTEDEKKDEKRKKKRKLE